MLRIAIVGLGPWGACALERVVTTARHGLPAGLEIDVHVIEPGTPGSGVYDVTQPDYLLLNAPCGQLTLYPFATEATSRATASDFTTGCWSAATAGSGIAARSIPPASRSSPIISCPGV